MFTLLNDYSWQFLTLFVWAFALCIAGSLIGYVIRRRNDRRKFSSSLFIGDLSMGLLVGIIIFSLAVYYKQVVLYGDFNNWLEKTLLIGGVMFTGAAFAPKLIGKIDQWINNVTFDKLIAIMRILGGVNKNEDKS